MNTKATDELTAVLRSGHIDSIYSANQCGAPEAFARFIELDKAIEPSHCNICHQLLNQPSDPLSMDCGGDCVKCMADAGDPDCIATVEQVKAINKSKD